ncbi:LolA family protein [Streptomyces himalayensis]|uniref:Outer membrane lipoprotein carrier protein LolA n=1 Tax=Streptomyces himalayensis subsp. himalayensis TaxID=2756131 RepID=A0A7W0DMZ0_9ACTN|nr:outer membrane lipoprotein carrier protein LolA [Streptomyces himalayensis]MBA2948053.1 outer membrane lipoprotein carrier protein LolA [Streptomyces himalayensis subsp. himalayensis]
MAPYESGNTSAEGPGAAAEVEDLRAGRRRAARYVVPVAVVGVAAATIGLVPALADSGDPDLPKISAQELIEKIAASDVQQLSGTVKISTDLGLPSLGGVAGSFAPGGGPSGDDSGSSADPQAKLMELASGTHTLRVAADGPDKQKLSVLDDAAEYSLIRNGDEVWAYDSASNEAYHATGAEHAEKGDKAVPEDVPATPKELAEEALKAADDTTSVTVDGTAQVAGRDAYKLLIKPKQSGSTVGAISVAVDAKTGTPLKFTLTPASGGAAVVDAGFTKVDFAKPAASTFDFSPPKGAKVTESDELTAQESQEFQDKAPKSGEELEEGLSGLKVIGEGWNAIATFEMPGGQGLPSAGSGDAAPEAQQLLDALGDKVSGKFGSGTVFSTRLVNALVTDDGKVYAGAVTKDALVKAADAAK